MKTELDEVDGDIIVISEQILPELREQLAYLTNPAYDPDDNADDELRDQDIDEIETEIAKNERELERLKLRLERCKPMECDECGKHENRFDYDGKNSFGGEA